MTSEGKQKPDHTGPSGPRGGVGFYSQYNWRILSMQIIIWCMFLKGHPGCCVDNELRQRISGKNSIRELIIKAWEEGWWRKVVQFWIEFWSKTNWTCYWLKGEEKGAVNGTHYFIPKTQHGGWPRAVTTGWFLSEWLNFKVTQLAKDGTRIPN